MNLLKIKYIRNLFKARWFPIVPQLGTLLIFILLIIGGLGVTANNPDFIYWLRNTNLSNLVVWSYWWPLIIITAIVLGRFWCTICPMELITYWAGKIGLRLQVPGFLKSGWVVTIFYTLIWIVGIHTLAINRIPHQMAVYMLILLILAIDISLIFRKRAFCSYICPVGHLLGLYSMISPFEWRADDASVCKSCQTKDCIDIKNNYHLTGRSCTSNLYPASIKDNRNCLLCTQCLKVCPNKNIRFSLRRPFADLFNNIDFRPAQVGFILLLSGFVVFEILSEWSVSLAVILWLPERFIQAFGITGTISYFVSAVIMFIVVPAISILILAALAKFVSGRKTESFGAPIATFALLLLPTVAGVHIIKSLLKMSSRIPYWPNALTDPKGIETAQQIYDETFIPGSSVTDALEPAISFAAVTLLLSALAITIQIFQQSPVVQKHSKEVKLVMFLGMLAYWCIFAVTIFIWRYG